MTDRLQCCVPFCRRTTKRAEFDEWICGDHWRLIPKPMRMVYGRYLRRWRRYGSMAYGVPARRIWNVLKREAIERSMGIAA